LNDEWYWRKNLLLFRIEEYPHGSYFSTLTIRGKVEFEMRVDVLKWHIYSVRRLRKGNIQVAHKFNYLGFMLGNTGNWNTQKRLAKAK
jgi:hypothetical protein